MNVYYTSHDGGHVKKFPHTITRLKAVEELKQKRIKDEETGTCLSFLMGWTVHSVFFAKNYEVQYIWDSTLNDYRSRKYIKGLKIPTNLK